MIKNYVLPILLSSFGIFYTHSSDHSGIQFYVKNQEDAALYVKLFQAIDNGKLEELKELITENHIVIQEVRGALNNTLLHEAALVGQVEIVRFLLSIAADPLARNKKFNTPFHYAAQTDNNEIMDLLLHSDPRNIEVPGWLETRPLHWAAKRGKLAMVTHLLKLGAQVNAKTSGGDTPLSEAILEKHELVVQKLLENGAETPLQNYQFKGPINIAIEPESYKPEIVALLKAYMDRNPALQAKLDDACCVCLDNLKDALPINDYARLHQLTCCKKIAHQQCLARAMWDTRRCPLCRKNQESLLVDTSAPHDVPSF